MHKEKMRIFLSFFIFLMFTTNIKASFNQYNGIVERGEQLGELINLKTANLYVRNRREQSGIYACYVDLPDLNMMNKKALCFFEQRPSNLIEAHILEFDQNIYGQSITIRLSHFIREFINFETQEEGLRMIEDDKNQAHELLD
ncbi:MAG: riboflavin kinase [Alphaproteobacteria bacterium]|nr:riboflavin kinase [Alphaproteobacteria bacterium]